MILGALISAIELANLPFLASLFGSENAAFREMIMSVYRFEALAAVPLGANAAVFSLLYGLGKTKLTMLLGFSRVFVFRIPVFWYIQHFTQLGERGVGVMMMVSNYLAAASSLVVAFLVIRGFKREHGLNYTRFYN